MPTQQIMVVIQFRLQFYDTNPVNLQQSFNKALKPL